MAPQRVVVVGGGIAGLTAAYRLLHPVDAGTSVPGVVLIDGAERLGGKILTTPFAGRPVDEGADAFLLRVPWAAELCDELGITDERISPAVGGASVMHRGRRGPQLTPLPDGLAGGVPTRLGPLVRSPLLGPVGTLRAAADYVLPRRFTTCRPDTSVGDIVRTRLGAAVASQVVDPLLGSISAGNIDRLEAATSAPILGQALGRSRSLMRGLRCVQPAPVAGATGPAPIFGSFDAGMGRLVIALAQRLDGCILRLGETVQAIRRPGTRFAVDTGSEALDADAVIIAAPAYGAAEMLPTAPHAAGLLAQITYASVAVVTLSVRPDVIEAPREAGFLVAREAGWLATACSYGSAKWPQWSSGGGLDDGSNGDCDDGGDADNNGGTGGAGNIVLRVSVGRDDDDRHAWLEDAELCRTVLAELSSLPPLRGLSDPGAITAWRISRWPRALPQYRPGHGQLVDRIEETLAREMPGVVLTGAAYRGLGIPACIRQGNEAAAAVTQYLADRDRDARA